MQIGMVAKKAGRSVDAIVSTNGVHRCGRHQRHREVSAQFDDDDLAKSVGDELTDTKNGLSLPLPGKAR